MNTNGILDYLDSFVQENADLIDSFNFDELYDMLLDDNDDAIPYFSELLYNNGIDPLPYMSSIPFRFLRDVENVKNIIIPSNIQSICDQAFCGCKDLETITINDGVKEIDGCVFDGCISLTELKFPKTLEYLDTHQKFPIQLETLDFSEVDVDLVDEVLYKIIDSAGYNDNIFDLILPPNYNLDLEELYAKFSGNFFKNHYVNIKIGSNTYSDSDIIKKIKSYRARIPTLYRVGDLSGELSDRVLVAFMKQDTLEVTMRTKSMIPESRCALFFTSEKDAEDFMDRAGFDKVESGKYNTKRNGLSRIHKARISSNDKNFTLINTPFGECYVQSWKADKYIDPKYIIKKDCF